MTSPLSRAELFEAARRWQAGERPVASKIAAPNLPRKQTRNPFPRMDLVGDLVLSFLTMGLWSVYSLHRLLVVLRRDDPKLQISSPITILLWCLTCGVYGFMLQLRLSQCIENMRVRHGLPAHRTWIGHIVGFFLVVSPPLCLHLLNLRIHRSSEVWDRKHRIPSTSPNRTHPKAGASQSLKWAIGILVSFIFLSVLGASTDEPSGLDPTEGGKPIAGAIAIDTEQLMTWSPTHDTMQIRTWEDGIQWGFPTPTSAEPKRVRLHPNGKLVVLGPRNELMISTWSLQRKPKWTSIPIDSAMDFEILSDERLLTWGKSGRVTIIDIDNGTQQDLLGLNGRVMGATELRNGHILAWTHAGNLQSWTPSGSSQWTHDHAGGTIRQVAESMAGWLLVAPRDQAPFLLQPDAQEIQSLSSHADSPLAYSIHDMGEMGFMVVYRSGEVERYSPTGEHQSLTQVMTGPISGTQIVDAPQGGPKEIVMWNRANEMVLFQQTGDSIQLMNEDSTVFSHRILGVMDSGNGSITTWDRKGVLRRWEF